MNRDEFINELSKAVQDKIRVCYGLEADTSVITVDKNNIKATELSVRFPGENIVPAVRIDNFYEDFRAGIDIDIMAESITEQVFNAYRNAPELPRLTPDEAKRHITLTLMNTEHNREYLTNVPHFDICGGELSAIPRWLVSPEASFVVNNDLARSLNLTPDEVLQIGQSNINAQEFKAISMSALLTEMTGQEFEDGAQMIVLTSEDRIQGSKAMLSEKALNMVHDRLGDFTILPSSIHEVICIPAGGDPEELRAMVKEINETQVSPEERLSDNIFSYDGMKLSILSDAHKIEPEITNSITMSM